MWCVALGRTLTTDTLRKRGIIITVWCFMCKNHQENLNHLFIHCVVAWELCSVIFCLFGVSWMMPHSVQEMLSCWMGLFGKRSNGGTWKAVPLCLMWCLWRERNAWCFWGQELSVVKRKELFLKSLYNWTSLSPTSSVVGFLEFLDFLSFL